VVVLARKGKYGALRQAGERLALLQGQINAGFVPNFLTIFSSVLF